MTISSALEPGTSSRKRMIGLLLVLFGVSICLGHFYVARHKVTSALGIDFRAVYGSGRCIISGCNPYVSEETKVQFLKQGGTAAEAMTAEDGPFRPHFVGYPPPALVYMVPFALLRWPLALIVYLSIAMALYVVAALLFADLCLDYNSLTATAFLALFVAVHAKIVWLGQPTLLAAALLCIGVWCLLKDRFPWLGVVSFALSLVFKPQLGAFFLLYFLLTTPSYRKRAWQVIVVSAVLSIPAVLWFSTHIPTRNWVQDYRENLKSIEAPGNLSDPGPSGKLESQIIDLQTVVSHYRDEPKFYNHVVWALSAIVLAAWLYPVIRRRPGLEKDLLCLAAIAAFSMLPIYHKVYDSRALLILFPAVALLLQRTLWWGRVAAIATVLLSLALSDSYVGNSYAGSHLVNLFARHPLFQVALIHPVPLILLAITVFYLAVLYVVPPSLAPTLEAGR